MSVDLSTRYLGLALRNPLVASSGPLTEHLDSLRQLEDAGAAAVILPSLFQEQLEHEELAVHQLHEFGTDSFGEALDYFPEINSYNTGPERYLETIRLAKRGVRIPVIASLNGSTRSGWERFARLIEEAGADALELNIYIVPTNPEQSGAEVEQQYIDLVAAVRSAVRLPLAVKIGPFFSAPLHMGRRLVEAGADGLVLFNRYLHPEIDLESLSVEPYLQLSTPAEARLPRQWIAILRSYLQVSLAHTSGINTAEDVIKSLLVGADVVMLTSALLRQGTSLLTTLLAEIEMWLSDREYVSVEQMQGSLSQLNSPNPKAFERSNYMRALTTYTGKEI